MFIALPKSKNLFIIGQEGMKLQNSKVLTLAHEVSSSRPEVCGAVGRIHNSNIQRRSFTNIIHMDFASSAVPPLCIL